MRALSPALLAAIGQAAPLVMLELIDAAPHYTAVYSGGPAGRTSAALAADGSLAQAYADGAGSIYARRVTDPTQPSWGVWSALTTTASANGALCLARLADRLRLFWQDGAGTQLVYRDSLDNGQSWSAAAFLFDAGAAVAGIAADGANGQVFVQYQVGALWRVALWSLASGWSKADWSNGDAFGASGLGVTRNQDGSYLVAVALQLGASAGTSVQACSYAGTWSGLAAVTPADLAAGLNIQDPRLAAYDGRYHLCYGVVDSGAISGLPSARAALCHSLDGVHWTDPLEDANSYAHGAVALKHAAGYLLAAPDSAALAPLYSASAAQYRDCTPDLSRLEVVQKDGEPARLVATLQNDAGQYSGGLPALRPNACLRLSLGYAGAGMVPTHLLYIEEWSFAGAVGERELIVTAADATNWLDRQSRTTLLYSARSVDWLVREVLARAGLLAVTLPATPQFAQSVASFAVPAGATWREALGRLSRIYGFDVAARAQPDGSDAVLVVEKNPADAPVWSYGGEVELITAAESADRANHVLVYGAPAVAGPPIGESWDWADVTSTGQERYLHVVEPLITTRAGAAIRAALQLNREQRRAHGGAFSVALHPGLELWDVVAATGDGLPPALRVATLHHLYEPHPGSYDLILTFEGP